MAVLFRCKYGQHKWLVKKQVEFIPNNSLIPRETLLRGVVAKQFKQAREIVRREIANFYSAMSSYRMEAMTRATRRYKARLVLDTIAILINHKKTLNSEAFAAESLSKKIATNICNNDNLINSECEPNIQYEIDNLMSWHLAIPETAWGIAQKSLHQLPLAIKPFIKITAHDHNLGAELWIHGLDMTFMVDFHEDDLGKILIKIGKEH